MFSITILQRIILCVVGVCLLFGWMIESSNFEPNKWFELALAMLAAICFLLAALRKAAK